MTSFEILQLLLLLALLIGHGAFWIWLYNRLNATGLARKTIKRLEKVVVLLCLFVPMALAGLEWWGGAWGADGRSALTLARTRGLWHHASVLSLLYGAFSLLFLAIVGPRWMAHRPQFALAKNRYRVAGQSVRKKLHRDHPDWIRGRLTRYCLKLPGNEILNLETNCKHLHVQDLPASFAGLRIGHLSDIHLAGQVSEHFPRLAVDWVLEQQAELLVVSGDFADDPIAIASLRNVFGHVPASLPCIFVLGNHDRAHNLVEPVRDLLVGMGWWDAGAVEGCLTISRGTIQIFGNELPWLDRHPASADRTGQLRDSSALRLGVAHSPDQFPWARRRGCHLLLCGHTHGGQVRLPGIGPIIAPSWHGSRYASGVFYEPPTVMHVSRGVSGTHPIRWRCSPEASVLVLEDSKRSPHEILDTRL